MANPSGVNGFTPPANETPYGDAQVNAAVQRSAPLAGQRETARATDTPRRSQRQAVRGGGQEGQEGPAPQMPGAPAQIAPSAAAATFWQQVASVPGASPLVQQLAQEAAGGVQNVPAS